MIETNSKEKTSLSIFLKEHRDLFILVGVFIALSTYLSSFEIPESGYYPISKNRVLKYEYKTGYIEGLSRLVSMLITISVIVILIEILRIYNALKNPSLLLEMFMWVFICLVLIFGLCSFLIFIREIALILAFLLANIQHILILVLLLVFGFAFNQIKRSDQRTEVKIIILVIVLISLMFIYFYLFAFLKGITGLPTNWTTNQTIITNVNVTNFTVG